MPRNGVGIYSLPSGINPVVPGTTIDATWANPTLTDIAAGLTGSLSRDGQAPMTGPLKLADGSVSSPGISWNSDSSTGFFRPATGALGIGIGGIERLRISGNELSLSSADVAGSTILSKINNVAQWAVAMERDNFIVKQYDAAGEIATSRLTIRDGGQVETSGSFTVSDGLGFARLVAGPGGNNGGVLQLSKTNANGACTIAAHTGTIARWAIFMGDVNNAFLVSRHNEAGSIIDYPLAISGTTGAITASNDIVAYSDARLKKDVLVIENALAKTNRLRGVTFTRTDTNVRGTGVIAQEVEKVLPEAVQAAEDGTLAVAYGNMVGLLIEAVKELTSRVKQLEVTCQSR